ncbi:endonuclease/exonuclease/phosphatase family protein [Patescibacteria group bacterium]|nr:endonuclease/exonuclease/phosphatase family protein [Patescibacteria group bacterium]
MKVYSWNVKFNNKKIAQAFEFIEKLDFDVIGLQEVPSALLTKLKTLEIGVVYTADTQDESGTAYQNVILSRLPIVQSQDFAIPIPSAPLRTRLFVRSMYFYGWLPLIEKRGIYVDVMTTAGVVRVFSLHLTLLGPMNRLQEFDAAFKKIDENIPTIIVGDFNIIERPVLKIGNWLLGSPFSQGLPWYSERTAAEKLFAEKGLLNPLRGQITHPFSNSQLDHILVSKNLAVQKAWVEILRHGSDHRPVGIELNL